MPNIYRLFCRKEKQTDVEKGASTEQTALLKDDGQGQCNPVQTGLWAAYGASSITAVVLAWKYVNPGLAIGLAMFECILASCIAAAGQDKAMCCDQQYADTHPTWDSICCPTGESTAPSMQ